MKKLIIMLFIGSVIVQSSIDAMDNKFPLLQAVEAGDAELVEVLLISGADPNQEGFYGCSPLHVAVAKERLAVVQTLIKYKAAIDQRDSVRYTPLHLAAHQGNPDVIQALLDAGADGEARSPLGDTPLNKAFCGNHEAAVQILVNELIRSGRNIDYKNFDGKTPLHLAAQKGYKAAVQSLITARANIYEEDNDGEIPLQLAAKHRHFDVALIFIDSTNINRRDKVGKAILHRAAAHGDQKIIHRLLDAGADINLKDKEGRSPLHLAALHCNKAAAQTLLDANANALLRDNKGFTPVDSAKLGGYYRLATFIEKYMLSKMGVLLQVRHPRLGANNPTLQEAPVFIYQEIFKWLKKVDC